MQTLNFGGQTMAIFSILSVFKPAGRDFGKFASIEGGYFR